MKRGVRDDPISDSPNAYVEDDAFAGESSVGGDGYSSFFIDMAHYEPYGLELLDRRRDIESQVGSIILSFLRRLFSVFGSH